MKNAANKQELVIIYPQGKGETFDPDFWALLSFLKGNHIDYRLMTTDLTGECSLDFEGFLIYLHISDITYLHKLNAPLSQFKKNNSLIIAGGTAILSVESDKILDTFKSIDIIARAPETEKVLVQLVKTIFNHKNWQTVKGITYRHPSRENKIISTKNRPLSKNLDYLDNLGIYQQNIQNAPGDQWFPVMVSRGCDGDCMYCTLQTPYWLDYNTGKTTWRKKSTQKVVDDIEFLFSKGIDKFILSCHRFFGSKKNHASSATALAREILRRELKVKFKFIALAGDLKRNLQSLFVLREAGLDEIQVGIDSGAPRFHDMYRTGSTVQDCMDVLRFLHENRFKFNISYIFYDPYLTIPEIKETVIFLKKIKEYFSHLELPYSAYLDSRILNSALILRYGMPIIKKLREDGLLVEYPGYSAHPASVFREPAVKNIYRVYRQVNETILPKIRHFFYDKELVTYFNNSFELFPLMVMEKIVHWVENEKSADSGQIVAGIERFTKDFFGPLIDNICDAFPKYKNPVLSSWVKQ
ncbi:MAG: radical SAM protein [Candidatus Aminicenantes bacterium]|nr:radical SAM protein [Candidatus Aminicenantes bacterium]